MITIDFDVDVSQLEALAARAAGAIGVANGVASAVVAKTTRDIESDAKSMVPVLTGELRASIVGTVSGLTGVIDAEARYAPYVEFGTYKDPTQPFMMPALEANENPFVNDLGNRVADAIEAAL